VQSIALNDVNVGHKLLSPQQPRHLHGLPLRAARWRLDATLAAQADRAARAFATVCAATGLPSFVPLALAAASIDPEPTTHTHKLFNERAALCAGRIPR
jgi:hypothetical protein